MSSFGLQNQSVDVVDTSIHPRRHPLNFRARVLKRSLDLTLSIIGLFSFGLLIFIAYIAATLNTGKNGFFLQTRVGRDGQLFRTIKVRTMRDIPDIQTNVTSASDPRITRIGQFLRRTKIDELPQLWNVLVGDMSFVGPRPDVPGFADKLCGEDRIILTIRPGITGPATIRFRDEEELLAQQTNPEQYNREVIYPEKIRLNREYIANYHVGLDLKYILHTLRG